MNRSNHRRTAIYVGEDGRELGTVTLVAEALGVPVSQVSAWISRRQSNGCPEAVPDFSFPSGSELDPAWFDLAAWRAWYEGYVPDRRQLAARCNDPDRGTASDVARILGVPPKRVHRWVERRASNGCPSKGEDGFYDLASWITWAAPRLREEAA